MQRKCAFARPARAAEIHRAKNNPFFPGHARHRGVTEQKQLEPLHSRMTGDKDTTRLITGDTSSLGRVTGHSALLPPPALRPG